MSERIRARFFTGQPGAILFFIPEGASLNVEALQAPFGNEEIRRACGDVQISECLPEALRPEIVRARLDARAERGQRQRQDEANQAVVLRGSIQRGERSRSEVVLEKLAIDERIRALKGKIAQATSLAATTGRYMDREEFRSLEAQLENEKQKSQALQVWLGKLRSEEKDRNRLQQISEERAFMQAARETLDEQTFDKLLDLALARIEACE